MFYYKIVTYSISRNFNLLLLLLFLRISIEVLWKYMISRVKIKYILYFSVYFFII